jgi:RecA/RadA recombinase
VSKPDVVHLDPIVFPDGLKPGEFIEISGEEGVGKTQFTIHVLANAVLPKQWKAVNIGGLEAGVVLVDTCQSFDVLRLVTVLEQRLVSAIAAAKGTSRVTDDNRPAPVPGNSVEDAEDGMAGELESCVRQCLDKLLIVRCNNTSQWLVTLRSLESVLATRTSIRILLIDSVDGFYVADKFNKTESRFTLCIGALHKLVQTHRLVVMASRTQHAGYIAKKGVKRNSAGLMKSCEEDSEYWSSWRHLVNQRLLLAKYCSPGELGSYSCLITDSQQSVRGVFSITDSGIYFRTIASA